MNDDSGPGESLGHAANGEVQNGDHQGPSQPDEQAVGRPTGRFSHALSWSYVLTGSRLVVTLVVSLVLARILGPEAFGLVAMGLAFVAFVELLVKQGLSATIIQRRDLHKRHLDAAFALIIAAITVLTPTVLIASGWWAGVNGTPGLQPILLWLSLLLPLKGLAVVPEALLARDLQFRSLALRAGVATFVGGMVGVIAAVLGAGVWSLVAQQLTMATIELWFVWQLGSWRPRARFDPGSARELLGFSSSMTLASFAQFLERQADSVLIGVFFGPVVVGLYRMAARLVGVATQLASGAVRATFLPELSRFEHDRAAFVSRAFELLRISTLLAIPLLGGLVVVARPALSILGEEWLPALPAVQLLAVMGALSALSLFTGPILQAMGRPGLLAGVTTITGLASVGAFAGAGLLVSVDDPAQQVTAVAAARTLGMGATFLLVFLPLLARVVGIGPKSVARAVAPATAAALTGVAVVSMAGSAAGDIWPASSVGDLFLSGSLYLGATLGVLLLLEPLTRRIGSRLVGRAGRLVRAAG